MRIILHDLDKIDNCFNENDILINTNESINKCVGCFSCWIKTPKKCIHKDSYDIVDKLKDADELVIISKCRYGCYSANIKRYLERTIGYVLPYFTLREGFIHHISRYSKKLKFSVYIYGDITNDDKKCIEDLVKANGINLNVDDYKVKYLKELENVYIN